MALPPLEGDIILRDNASAAIQRALQAATELGSVFSVAQKSAANLESELGNFRTVEPQLRKLQESFQKLSSTPLSVNAQGATAGITSIVDGLNRIDKEAAEAKQNLQQVGAARPAAGTSAGDGGITAAAQAGSQARIAAFEAEQQRRQQIFSSSIGQLTRFESILTAAQQTEEQKRVALASSSGQARRAALQSTLTTFGSGEIDQITTRLLELQRQAQLTREKIGQIDQRTSGPRSGGLSATQNEVRERERLYQELSNIAKAEEAEITQAVQRESQNRLQAARGEAQQRGQGFNAVGALRSAAGIVGIGIGVREIAQQAVDLTKLGTSAQRAAETFNLLTGSAEKGAAAMRGIREASGNTVTNLEAGQIANKAFALGMAKTGEELERVTRFAVTASRVLGGDVAGTLDNLALAASNLSFRRLDQMGVSASQVKDEMDKLKATTTGLSQEQLFLQATLNVGERTFAALGNSAVTNASGLEILSARLRQLKEDAGGFTADTLNPFFAKLAFVIGGGGLPDEINTIKDNLRGLQKLASENFNSTGPFDDVTQKQIEDQRTVIKVSQEALNALAQGKPGAEDYADGVKEIARSVALWSRVTDDQIAKLEELSQKYGLAQNATTGFSETRRRAAEEAALLALEAQKADAQGRPANLFGFGGTEGDAKKVAEIQVAIDSARESAAKGIPIVIDPKVRALVPDELKEALGSKIYDEVAVATERLIAAQEALKQAQFSPAAQEAGLVSVRKALLDVAQAEFDLANSRADVSDATGVYNDALRKGTQAEQEHAGTLLEVKKKALEIAEVRNDAALASLNLVRAERELGDAYARMGKDGATAAEQALAVAQAQNEAAQSALRAATGQSEAVDLQAEAAKAFAHATREAEDANRRLVDSMTGLPVAFDISKVKAEDLKSTLLDLMRATDELSIHAQDAGFGIAKGLIPSLGLGGALAQAQQNQAQIQQATNVFNAAQNQRVQAGQSPVDPRILDFVTSGITQYQQALVSDAQNAGRAAEQSAKAFEGMAKRIDDALTGLIEDVIKPTTSGLIEGSGLPQGELDKLLPREDEVDERARRVADVAVKGFKSPWYEGLKDLQVIPQDVLDKGEDAIRKWAAGAVRDHTKGLRTDFIDVDKAVEQVVERITSKQNQNSLVDQIREKVKDAVGNISDLDIKDALGIDTSADRQAEAIKSAVAGLATPEQLIEQMGKLLTGEGAVESPLVKAMTVTEEQKGTITKSSVQAMTAAGEAMVTQANDGKYGERSISVIIAAIEAKSTDIKKSGAQVAKWLGGTLLDEFSDTVPIGLLNILVTELVPMLVTALAEEKERTGGTGVQ